MPTHAVEATPLNGKSSSHPRVPLRLLNRLAKSITRLFATDAKSEEAPRENDDECAVASSVGSVAVSEQRLQIPATQPNASRKSRPSNISSLSGSSRRISSPEKLYCLFCGTNKDAQATDGLASGRSGGGSSRSSSSGSPKSSPVSGMCTATTEQSIIATRAGPEMYKVRDRLENLARGPDDTTIRYTWFRDGLEQSRPPTRHDAALGRCQQRTRRQLRMPTRMDRCVDARDGMLPYRSVEYKGELDNIEEAIGAMGAATF
ncbi:hypothetical protein F4775DRAFT_595189 [Biscogniauxia sp. FL1348]|nr:hypothetical protein F4775DRAFT_595189 [Biscogniauxia sp. FL1348]